MRAANGVRSGKWEAKSLLTVLLLTSHVSLPTSHAASKDAGTAGAQFLKLGVGARYLAMGEAASAAVDDVNALYWNPANLSRLDGTSLSVMYGAYVESVNYQYAAFAGRVGRLGTVGASMQMLSAGTISQTDDTGRTVGTILPRDMAAGLGWGRSVFGRLAAGASVKHVRSRIVESASTVAADAGLSYLGDRLTLAAVMRHAGGRLEFATAEDDLPLTFQTGASYRLTRHWSLSADGIFPKDAASAAAGGTEYALPIGREAAVAFRAGYNTRYKDVPGLQGFSAGLGGRWNLLDVDYAWVPLGDLGQTHRASITVRFSRPGDGRPQRAAGRP
jgi:hypothetical protein